MTTWLIARGLSPGSARWIARGVLAVIVAIVLGSAYASGYRAKGYEVAKLALARQTDANKALEKLRKENARLSADLQAEKSRDRTVFRQITKKVKDVAPEIVHAPTVSGAPAVCTISNDFVQLWNDALFARMPAAAGGSADPGARAGSARTGSPGLRPHDLLANHVENSETCHDIRRQLNALIAWHKANDQ